MDASGRIAEFSGVRPLPEMRVNINAAGAAEFALLPGIGPRLAERIVTDREANGPFESVEDLDRVRGIGTALVERMRPHVRAGLSQATDLHKGEDPTAGE